MRTLSKRCKYALRALYCLTRSYDSSAIAASAISLQQHIPRKFLEAILVQLRNGGVVESRQGKNGGYALARPPDQISLGSIIRLVDGPLAPLPCASESAFRPCHECVSPEQCETRAVMKAVRDAVATILDGTTLEKACSKNGKNDAFDFTI